MAPRRMDVWSVLVRIAVIALVLKAIVWWLEPRMAFFPVSGVQATPQRAGIPFRELRIETADRERLHAWWLERPDASAQVVYFHGNGGNLSLWLEVFVELWRRGFSVLAVDYRGYGDSTGSASEKGLYSDAEATVRLFDEELRDRKLPAVFWGRSIGAPVAAHAAAIVPPDALILEAPMPDVRSVLRTNPVLWVLSFLSSYEFPTSRLLESYRGPLLVIHGDADSIVPFRAGRAVFERAPTARKTLVTVGGADHNDLHLVDTRQYWTGIGQFMAGLSKP